MTPVSYKCPFWFVLMLFGIALLLGLLFPFLLVRFLHLPGAIYPYFIGAGLLLALFATALLPTELDISDDGFRQSVLISKFHVRWENLVEWHLSRTQDINVFWLKDRAGKQYNLKTWLILGQRSRQITKILRDKGIPGRETIGR
jgi:hypothetical protein